MSHWLEGPRARAEVFVACYLYKERHWFWQLVLTIEVPQPSRPPSVIMTKGRGEFRRRSHDWTHSCHELIVSFCLCGLETSLKIRSFSNSKNKWESLIKPIIDELKIPDKEILAESCDDTNTTKFYMENREELTIVIDIWIWRRNWQ